MDYFHIIVFVPLFSSSISRFACHGRPHCWCTPELNPQFASSAIVLHFVVQSISWNDKSIFGPQILVESITGLVGKVLKLRRKSYKILFVVVLLSTGPAIFSTLSWYLSFYCEECHKNASLRVAQIVFINMVLAKPAADPFAFAWRIPRYRQALRQTISCPFYRPPQMRHGKIAPMQMHRVEGDSATNTRDAARPQDIRPEGIQPEQTRRASTNGSMRWLLCISANLIPGERTSPEDSSKLKESRNTRLINKLCWRRPDLNRALRFDRSIARNPDKDKREDTNKFEETQERFDKQTCYRLPCS